MTKTMTWDGNAFVVHAFFCGRPMQDPPLPICEQQCEVCFELDAKQEYENKQHCVGFFKRQESEH